VDKLAASFLPYCHTSWPFGPFLGAPKAFREPQNQQLPLGWPLPWPWAQSYFFRIYILRVRIGNAVDHAKYAVPEAIAIQRIPLQKKWA
jgi:hypothetical protein